MWLPCSGFLLLIKASVLQRALTPRAQAGPIYSSEPAQSQSCKRAQSSLYDMAGTRQCRWYIGSTRSVWQGPRVTGASQKKRERMSEGKSADDWAELGAVSACERAHDCAFSMPIKPRSMCKVKWPTAAEIYRAVRIRRDMGPSYANFAQCKIPNLSSKAVAIRQLGSVNGASATAA
jgi:hypothetical protein